MRYPCSRREFFKANGVALGAITLGATVSRAQLPADNDFRRRIEGLLIGTYFGDALGGPVEFQPPEQVHALPNPPKAWAPGERIDISAAAARVHLRTYRELRPVPEPYAHWSHNAEPGTITDDSRHKLVLLDALREAHTGKKWPMTERDLARAYVTWGSSAKLQAAGYAEICDEWLKEIRFAAQWVQGERDVKLARPLERLWNGLPTCCGQMTFPPLAAIYPGEPEKAYLATYRLAFIDNGWGRDLNAAIVAGISAALVQEPTDRQAAWQNIFAAMRKTDPWGYLQVPWTERSVDRWLNFAQAAATEAAGRPAKLFEILNREFGAATKWEAQVCLVAAIAPLMLCEYDPLAAMQLSVEWGHDTDSYAQLLGAFVGALHGPDIFPGEMRKQLTERLQRDYGEALSAQVNLLAELSVLAKRKQLFA